VYRILKAHDLITSPQFTVMQAADKFMHPTSRVHELWQTDFTYFRVVGWGWYFLSTILDDYSRYIITWRLTTTMAAADVTGTLEDALKATGLSTAPGTAQTKITLGQRALLHQWRTEGMAEDTGHRAYPWRTISPADPGQD